jgi:hypothetical protein
VRRSELLTYWTGKDIATDPSILTAEIRASYALRLSDVLERGFWMTVPREVLTGCSGEQPATIRYGVPMTCFTELRISHSEHHWQRYGLVGIVVDRGFVLQRSGGPVLYMRSHPQEPLVGNVAALLSWLKDHIDRNTPEARDMMDAVWSLAGFLKPMSGIAPDDFAFLDELEWRIIHTDHQERAGRIRATGLEHPEFRVPIGRQDVRMLIVPDADVRAACMPTIMEWAGGMAPPVLAISDLSQL